MFKEIYIFNLYSIINSRVFQTDRLKLKHNDLSGVSAVKMKVVSYRHQKYGYHVAKIGKKNQFFLRTLLLDDPPTLSLKISGKKPVL